MMFDGFAIHEMCTIELQTSKEGIDNPFLNTKPSQLPQNALETSKELING